VTRRLRYQVAVSLDGFIATDDGGYSWIVEDHSIDLGAFWKELDTAVMGRKTYDLVCSQPGGKEMMKGIDCVVFSRTLPASSEPGWRIVNDDPGPFVKALKKEKGRGKDIWLFGGGELFRTLLDAGVVDTVEMAVMPVMLGSGIPVLPAGRMAELTLTDHKVLPSGIIMVAYSLPGASGAAPKIRYVKRAAKKKPAKKRSRARRE
jgi:dihydrofolate reductase